MTYNWSPTKCLVRGYQVTRDSKQQRKLRSPTKYTHASTKTVAYRIKHSCLGRNKIALASMNSSLFTGMGADI